MRCAAGIVRALCPLSTLTQACCSATMRSRASTSVRDCAIVAQLNVAELKAKVVYPLTSEVEEMELGELLDNGEFAVSAFWAARHAMSHAYAFVDG